MAIISGKVLYDPERYLLYTNIGIPDVPVVLFDGANDRGAVAMTDRCGMFRFTDVPAGEYLVCEDYSPSRTGSPVVNYMQAAQTMTQPGGGDPPYEALKDVLNFPHGADALDSLTPNTVAVTASEDRSSIVLFYDGPIGHCNNLPATDPDSENLLSEAGEGEFGLFPAGSTPNTCVEAEPYRSAVPGFVYRSDWHLSPGEYTILGTLRPSFGRHTLSDHTTGQETGRMLFVNGNSGAGHTLFTQKVEVEPDTEYLFSAWAVSANRFTFLAPAHIALEVTDEKGGVLMQSRHLLDSTFLPIWRKVGGKFHTGEHRILMVRVSTWGDARYGDDLLLDDISLRKALPSGEITSLRVGLSSNRCVAPIGSTIAFTAVVRNGGSTPAKEVFFQDELHKGLNFVNDSLTVDYSKEDLRGTDPTKGLLLGEIPANDARVIRYEAVIDSVPELNPISNLATVKYVAVDGEELAQSNPISVWASDRCFCQELCDDALLSMIGKSDLPGLLGIGECDLLKLLDSLPKEVCPQCPSVAAVLRKLGVFGCCEKE